MRRWWIAGALVLLVLVCRVARRGPDPFAEPRLDCAGLAPGDQDRTLPTRDGVRAIRLHVPPGAVDGAARPLVIVLHGGGQRGGPYIQEPCRMDPVADANGFLVAYPTGSARGLWGYTWNGGECCGRALEQHADDLGFISAMIDTMVAGQCVDPKRVYATGVSNGGMMAYHLACDLSDKIAAAAPIAASLMDSSCEPRRPVSMMILHGTGDTFVPYEGGGNFKGAGALHPFLSVPESAAAWRRLDRCGPEAGTTYARGDTSCVTYDHCAEGSAVSVCTVQGGGHTWPGGASRLDWWIGHTTQDIGNQEIWKFFAAHPMS